MSFVNPLILAAGLAAIAIPIAIHLLMRRRRKPTPWAAMRFLQEAIRKRRRRLQLERLLLLAVRCLLVAAIALALGRPIVRGLTGDTPFGSSAVTLAIVIDDSIASGAPDGVGAVALDRHREMALDLLESLRPERGDRAMLIPLSGPLASDADLSEASAPQPTSDLGAVGRLVEMMTPTEAAADLSGALALVADRVRAEGASDAVDGRWAVAVLADAVEGVVPDRGESSDVPAGSGDGGGVDVARLTVLASDPGLFQQGALSDVGLAAITPVRPVLVVGQGEAVALSAPARLTIGRSGEGLDSEARVGVRMRFVDDSGPGPWAEASTRLRAGEPTGSVVLEAPIIGRPRGLAYLEAELAPGTADAGPAGNDSAVAVVALRRQLTAAIIDAVDPLGTQSAGLDPENASGWLRAALAPEAIGDADPLADIAAIRLDPSVVDAPRLARIDVAFVLAPGELRVSGWRALAEFAQNGGLVIVFPDVTRSLAAWADAFTQAFALPWSIGPEAVEETRPLAITRGPSDDPLGVLQLIEGELESLLRPVTVSRRLPLARGDGEPASLLSLADGSPAALAARPGGASSSDGLVVVFAMPLAASWTDLPARPAIVPVVQELARAGVGLAIGAQGARAGASPDAPTGSVQLRPGWTLGAGGSIAPVRVDQEGRAARPLRRAGPWLALDGSGRASGLVAVTPAHEGAARGGVEREGFRAAIASGLGGLGDAAGDVEAVTWLDRPDGALADAVRPTDALAASEPSLALGAILLGIALALAALEAVLARQFSHAQVSAAQASGVATSREAA